MTSHNVELAREAADSMQALFDRLDDDVVWDNTRFGDTIPLDHVGVFAGKPAVIKVLRSWVGTWEDYRFEIEELVDAGESVVLAVRESGRGKASDVPMENRYSQVWTFRDGLIVSASAHEHKRDALAAAGLSE
jgi:ketosteroid isomerase-like protein